MHLRAFASVCERVRARQVAFSRVWSRLVAFSRAYFFSCSGTFGRVLSSFFVILRRHSSSFFVILRPKIIFSGMAGNGRLRQRLGREGSSLLRMVPAPGQDVHHVMIFVSNCFATAAGPRLRWFVLRTIVLQNRGVCSSWYCQGCSPDYCASSKAKGLKQLRPGLIARSRAECEHRVRALTRAADASLIEPSLNDLIAGQFDSSAADGLASISRPLRHGAPCASGADPTSSPARAVDRLPPPSCHLHVATAATLASHPSTAAVAAPPCLPSHPMSAAVALPPQRPNLGKHLLGPRAQMFCLRLLPFHCGPALLFSTAYSSSTPYHPHEILGCTPARSARSVLSPMHCCPSHGSPRLFAMRNITHP